MIDHSNMPITDILYGKMHPLKQPHAGVTKVSRGGKLFLVDRLSKASMDNLNTIMEANCV